MRPFSLAAAAVLLLSGVGAASLPSDALAPVARASTAAALKCSITAKSGGARNRSMRATPNSADYDEYYGGKFLYWGLRGYQQEWNEILSITGVAHSLRFDFWTCTSKYAGYTPQAASPNNSQTSLQYGQVRVAGSTTQCVTALPGSVSGSGTTGLTTFTVSPCATQDTKAVLPQLFVHVRTPIDNPALSDYFKWVGSTYAAADSQYGKGLGKQSCAVSTDGDWVPSADETSGHFRLNSTLRVGDASWSQCKHTNAVFTFL